MAITDKMKEIGEGIKKAAKESGIKDTAISAGMIITDKAKKSKESIENKIEENKIKIEEQRQHIVDIQNDIYTSIIENKILIGKSIFQDIKANRIVAYSEDFYKNVYRFYENEDKRYLYFSSRIPSRVIDKFNNLYEFTNENEKEEILFCYFGGNKDNFVLTTKRFYFNIKHFSECNIYSLVVDNDKISDLSVDELTDELKINNISVFKVDGNKGKILNKYFKRIKNNNLMFNDNDISNEIEEVISNSEIYDKSDLIKIKESFDENEVFKYFSRNYNKNKDVIVCTSNKLIVKTTKGDGLTFVNEINYRDIDFIDIEDEKDIIVVLNIFTGVSLEIIFQGTKIKIKDIDVEDARQIIKIVNEAREKISVESRSNGNNNDIFTKIEKLSKLKEMGAITDTEFESKKKELLTRI